jgi:hypothetical protein
MRGWRDIGGMTLASAGLALSACGTEGGERESVPIPSVGERCRVDGRVVDNHGKQGVVTKLNPVPGGGAPDCAIAFDDGTTATVPSYQVMPATALEMQVAEVAFGHYLCAYDDGTGKGARNANQSVDFGAEGYTDQDGHTGTWNYDPATRVIRFDSGAYTDWSAEYHGGLGFSLVAPDGSQPPMICSQQTSR